MQKLVSATYHLDLKTAEFVADSGDHLLRSGGTPAWRFNNPGNMRPPRRRQITTNIGHATMADGGVFLIFPDYQTGKSELMRLLKDPDGYGPKTLVETIRHFAPKKDHNDPEKYLRMVSDRTGIDKDAKLGDLSDSQIEKLADSIETMEGYYAFSSTRSEKWVKGAAISLSDGARPIVGQQVVIRQGAKEHMLTTGSTGSLPTVPLTGQSIDVWMQDAKAQLQKVATIGQEEASKSFLLVREMFSTQASTAPHVPARPGAARPRAPIAYRIEPGDSLSKIAKRFKTSVGRLKADNNLGDRDLIIVGKTLTIYAAAQGNDSHASQHASLTKPVEKVVPRARSHDAATHSPQQKPAAPADPTTPSVATASSATPASGAVAATAASDSASHVDVPRTQAGQGRPFVLLPPDQPRASWMAIAIGEAERWKGADESVITQTINYHAEVDPRNPFKTLVGSRNAWCAAFVNWVMLQDGRDIVANRTDRHRARKFVGDPNFPEIKQPIFGAIAVEANLGHVMFVYGRDSKTGNIVVLGGNQGGGGSFGGTIDFAEFGPSQIHGYYVPKTYLPFAQQEIAKGVTLPDGSAAELNKAHHIKDPKGHGTR